MTDDRLARMTLEGFLDVLGSDAPTPGGGAAGAVSGAIGAALIAMVGRLTVGKPGFEDVDDRMRALIQKADAARSAFLDLADRDAHAFDAVMAAFKMPKETDADKAARSAAILVGYEHAASVPLEIARAAVDLMELAEDATSSGNPQAASDGVSGAAHLYCAVICAIANVEINAASLKDEARRAALLDEVAAVRGRADQSVRESQTLFQLRLSS
ncbi:MAG: cyclodeaminase/cyclohydrolase family protein [Actinomycetota bacterium]